MIRRPPRSTPLYSSSASDVYKRQASAAGVATTVAGAALAPAIPLILAGGGLWSANIAREAKDKIFNECMKDRGYEVYIAN